MRILITGSNGFIGKNLIAELKNRGYTDLLEYDLDTSETLLDSFVQNCDFIFHLAGVNRPEKESDFFEGNFGFTSKLLSMLDKSKNTPPILITSSTQAELDNPYGRSKKAGEGVIYDYGKKNNVPVYVYRLPNVFGKWSKPNYNSAVATFCHNISRDIPIVVNDRNTLLKLVYIDDVINSFINSLELKNDRDIKVSERTLGEIVDLIYSFKSSRETLLIPNMSDVFIKQLYSTYLSFLPEDDFGYDLKMNVDDRGSFTEFIKSGDRGQVSINISKPHISKGNHWHHTKIEKFLVVSGRGVIRFRKIESDSVIEYFVSGDKLRVIDIPVGYTHNIENLGDTDLVTVMWVNEIFDKERPDTFFLKV